MKIAVIEDNVVVNIINAKSIEIAEKVTGKECISYQNGWDDDNDVRGFEVFYPPVDVLPVEPTE